MATHGSNWGGNWCNKQTKSNENESIKNYISQKMSLKYFCKVKKFIYCVQSA